MQDKLLIVTKTKKNIEYIENVITNFPKTEVILKNKLITSYYELLELVYRANIYKETIYMKEILVKIKMIEYYVKISLNKKIINFRKYEVIGNNLLELNKMINSWIMYEKSK